MKEWVMKHVILKLIFPALLLGLVFNMSLQAATTGKITGMVTDKANGEPLPGANVILDGTRQGATTDPDGRYVILAVSPGTYTVTGTMVGYGTEKRQNVNVIADYTSTIDFSLKESTLEMEELVVTAQRPPVEPDKTTSKYVISSADIEAAPQIRATAQLLALQPGMALDGTNSIRGSTTRAQTGTQVGYYVDGIEVDRNMLTGVNTTAIQEVSVLTGGMNAEFGNAAAGVVNLVTKEGQGSLQGRTEYKFTPGGKKHWGRDVYEGPQFEDNVKWDDPDWVAETYVDPGPDRVLGSSDDVERNAHERTDYTDKRGHRVEGTLSGSMSSDVSYFASVSFARDPATFPSVEQTSNDPPRAQATLTYRPSDNIKVKGLGMYQKSNEYQGAARNRTQNIFYPEEFSASGEYTLSRQLEVLTLTHTLGTSTYYDLKLFYNSFNRDTSNVPVATEATRQDEQGFFNLPTLVRQYREEEDTKYGVKFDFVSQVNSSHLFQTGLVLTQQAYHYTAENFSDTQTRQTNFVANGYDLGSNVKPWTLNLYAQDKVEFGGLVANLGLRWDYYNFGRKGTMAQALGRSPMYNSFRRARYELDHLDSSTPTMTALSPRVGFSHPITEKLAAHYFIGRMHTFAPIDLTHRRTFESNAPDDDLNGNGIIDPTEVWNRMEVLSVSWQPSDGMKPQRATSMEMGLDWNFVGDYTTSATAHYRRDEGLYASNNISYWIDPLSGQSIQVNALRNTYWQNARGIELSLKKAFSNHFQFNLSYNAEWVRDPGGIHYGKHSANWYVMPDADYIANGHYWTDWEVQADGSEVPVPLTPAQITDISAKAEANLQVWRDRAGTPGPGAGNYQEPVKSNENGIWTSAAGQVFTSEPTSGQRSNQLSLQFYYATPLGYGPLWSSIYPFGGLRVSMVYRLIGGTPFEYLPPVGAREFRSGAPRMKSDLYAAKDFRAFGNFKPTLFVEISNLFNEKSSDSRNTDFTYVQYGLKLPPPDDTDYLLYGDPNEVSRYDYNPREIEIGLEIKF
jgi:hypothetical protein